MPFKNPHPLYTVWQGMRRRCLTPTYRQWSDYGGRGITICDRWESFETFVADMGERPRGYTLDRVDNDGPYSPENCRWASRKEQQLNRRNTIYVDVRGEAYRLQDLADISGHKPETIRARVDKGLSYEEVISPDKWVFVSERPKGIKPRKSHCPQGHEYTPENVIIINKAKGTRACRICHNARARLKYDKVKMETPSSP